MKLALSWMGVLSVAILALVTGCAKKQPDGATGTESSATAAPSAVPPSAAAPLPSTITSTTAAQAPSNDKTAAACAALGCPGDGSFGAMCDCKAKPQTSPFQVKPTGKKIAGRPELEVTNTSDKPTHWASLGVYYYDRAGKQLTTETPSGKYALSRENGSMFTLKPHETRKISAGFSEKIEPKGTASIEVVVDGWCFGTYEDKASHLCVRNTKTPDERARAGR
jgi:hypothetical protein